MNSIYPRPAKSGPKNPQQITLTADDIFGTAFQDDWGLINKLAQRGSPFKYLIDKLSDHFNVSESEIKGSSKKREFANVRFYYAYLSMYVIRPLVSNTTFAPIRTIAEPLGRPSDLFLYYGYQFEDLFSTSKDFREQVKNFCILEYDEEFWAEVKRVMLLRGVKNVS